jgi:hypothetical protein
MDKRLNVLLMALLAPFAVTACEKAAEPAQQSATTNQVSQQVVVPPASAAVPVAPAANPEQQPTKVAAPKPAAPKASAGLTATGPASMLEIVGADSKLPDMDIVRNDAIANQQGPIKVRLIGGAGGDPAMNGLMTYIGFSTDYESMNFLIGDILDYKILRTAPGRIDLEISESSMDGNGTIGSKTRRAIIEWVINPDAETPVNVTLKPAS